MSGPLPATRALLDRWVAAGECMGYQLFAWRAGAVVADLAGGDSEPGRPGCAADLGRLYCAVKPLTAVCVARAVQAGAAGFDDPAARYLPRLASGPLGQITLRQLLSHTSGLPNLSVGDPYETAFADLVTAAGGKRLAPMHWYVKPMYNNTDAWNILGAVLEKLHGMALAEVIRREISEPLGLADLRLVVHDPARYAHCYRAARGSFRLVPGPGTGVLSRMVNPSHGGCSTIRDLGLFYAELIRCVHGAGRLLGQPMAREITRSHALIELGLGLEDRSYGLGFFAETGGDGMTGQWSGQCFGHCGLVGRQRVIHAFADAEHQVAVAIRLFSVGARNNWRLMKAGTALGTDLGISPSSLAR